MAVTKNSYGNYHELTGTVGEVLQALSDEKVEPHQLVHMADDRTAAVYKRGNA